MVRDNLAWLDPLLAGRPWIAGDALHGGRRHPLLRARLRPRRRPARRPGLANVTAWFARVAARPERGGEPAPAVGGRRLGRLRCPADPRLRLGSGGEASMQPPRHGVRPLIWNDLSSPTSSASLRLVAAMGEAEQATVEALRRRLITLIFADRASGPAVMVVIRRELPRTRVAGPARGLSHRSHEDPPFRVPFDRRSLCSSRRHDALFVLPPPVTPRGGASRRARPATPIAQMKPRSSRPTAVTTLRSASPCREPAVARMQSMLRLPGDLLDLLAQPAWRARSVAPDRRAVPVGPRRLDQRCGAGEHCRSW